MTDSIAMEEQNYTKMKNNLDSTVMEEKSYIKMRNDLDGPSDKEWKFKKRRNLQAEETDKMTRVLLDPKSERYWGKAVGKLVKKLNLEEQMSHAKLNTDKQDDKIIRSPSRSIFQKEVERYINSRSVSNDNPHDKAITFDDMLEQSNSKRPEIKTRKRFDFNQLDFSFEDNIEITKNIKAKKSTNQTNIDNGAKKLQPANFKVNSSDPDKSPRKSREPSAIDKRSYIEHNRSYKEDLKKEFTNQKDNFKRSLHSSKNISKGNNDEERNVDESSRLDDLGMHTMQIDKNEIISNRNMQADIDYKYHDETSSTIKENADTINKQDKMDKMKRKNLVKNIEKLDMENSSMDKLNIVELKDKSNLVFGVHDKSPRSFKKDKPDNLDYSPVISEHTSKPQTVSKDETKSNSDNKSQSIRKRFKEIKSHEVDQAIRLDMKSIEKSRPDHCSANNRSSIKKLLDQKEQEEDMIERENISVKYLQRVEHRRHHEVPRTYIKTPEKGPHNHSLEFGTPVNQLTKNNNENLNKKNKSARKINNDNLNSAGKVENINQIDRIENIKGEKAGILKSPGKVQKFVAFDEAGFNDDDIVNKPNPSQSKPQPSVLQYFDENNDSSINVFQRLSKSDFQQYSGNLSKITDGYLFFDFESDTNANNFHFKKDLLNVKLVEQIKKKHEYIDDIQKNMRHLDSDDSNEHIQNNNYNKSPQKKLLEDKIVEYGIADDYNQIDGSYPPNEIIENLLRLQTGEQLKLLFPNMKLSVNDNMDSVCINKQIPQEVKLICEIIFYIINKGASQHLRKLSSAIAQLETWIKKLLQEVGSFESKYKLLKTSIIDDIGLKLNGFIRELRRFKITVDSMIKQTLEAETISKNYFNFVKKKLVVMYNFFKELSETSKKNQSSNGIFEYKNNKQIEPDNPYDARKKSRNIPQNTRHINLQYNNKENNDDSKYYELYDKGHKNDLKYKAQSREFEKYREKSQQVEEKDLQRLKNSYNYMYNPNDPVDLQGSDRTRDRLMGEHFKVDGDFDETNVINVKLTSMPYTQNKNSFSKYLYSTGNYVRIDVPHNTDDYLLVINTSYTKSALKSSFEMETKVYIKDVFFISRKIFLVTFTNNPWIQFYAFSNLGAVKSHKITNPVNTIINGIIPIRKNDDAREKVIILGDVGGFVHQINSFSFDVLFKFQAHKSCVVAIFYLYEGKVLVTMSHQRDIKLWVFDEENTMYNLNQTMHPENYIPEFVISNRKKKQTFDKILSRIEIERAGENHLVLIVTKHILIFEIQMTGVNKYDFSFVLKTQINFKTTNNIVVYDANQNILINDGKYLYNYCLEGDLENNSSLQALIKVDDYVDKEFDPYCYGYSEDVQVYTFLERDFNKDQCGLFELWVPRKTKKFVSTDMTFFARSTAQTQILPTPKGQRVLKSDQEGKKLKFTFEFFETES